MAQDDDLAESLLYEEPQAGSGPVLSSWTQEVAELRVIAERLGIVAQLIGVLSRNRYEPPSLPRPQTARDRARLAANLRRHRRHVSVLIPGGG